MVRLRARMRENDRLAAMGELSATIAHEIRNPLASIRGSVELLGEELVLEGEQAHLMGLIAKESARLDRLICDFLDYARLKPAALLPTDLSELVQDVAALLRLRDDQPEGLRVEVEDAAPGLEARADAELLQQVLYNLGLNALQAMGETGTLTISVGVDRTVHPPEAVLRFEDEGPGIDEEDLAAPLRSVLHHQEERDGSRPGRGPADRGQSCGQAGGPQPDGGGSRIRALPAADRLRRGACLLNDAGGGGHFGGRPRGLNIGPGGEPGPQGSRRRPGKECQMNKGRILIVDDEESMCQFLSIMLKKDGHEVVTTTTGPAALREMQKEPFDAVITDIQMPKMDGIQVLAGVKAIDPDVPVIIMTAYASKQTAIEAVNMGAFHYLDKHAKNDEIKMVVRNALDIRQVKGENHSSSGWWPARRSSTAAT